MKIKCECYSRVSGYYRPVNQFNKGKQEEFYERTKIDAKQFTVESLTASTNVPSSEEVQV